jgi:hypothetical protein
MLINYINFIYPPFPPLEKVEPKTTFGKATFEKSCGKIVWFNLFERLICSTFRKNRGEIIII